MKKKPSCSFFVRILLATLLPLILIFSVVFVSVTKKTFQIDAEAAQEKIIAFARHSAEQVRSNLLGASRLMKIVAWGLGPMADDSDRAREEALEFMERIFENTSNVHRIWMYFGPEEGAFGKDRPFAYEIYPENGVALRRPLTPESGLDLSLPQYDIPLKNGIPYHYSIVSQGISGQDEGPAYICSANYPVIHNGQVIGCVGIDMLYRRSFPLIDQWKKGGSHIFFIREEGMILYAADASLVGRNIDSLGFDSDFLENITTGMRQKKSFMGEGFSPVSGKESLICVYPVERSSQLSRLFIYIDTPIEIVYSGAKATARANLFTFLIGLLLFVGSLFAVTRNIVGPIKKLTEKANRIANGQFDALSEQIDEIPKTRDEIYSLECSLQKMLKELVNNPKLKIIAMKAEHEKKELEETAAAKDRFFANMSHEIRTPMNVILGVSEILLTEKLTSDQRIFVQDIKIAAEGLLDIINDILDLSRLESGKLSLSRVHYDFCILVENIYSLGKYLAGKKGLDFRLETIGDTPEYLYGDDGRLRQVLLNIIGNAIKFTETGAVTLVITSEGETLDFDIIDTGIGIRDEDRQYLFEPFKQIDRQQVRNVKGTGLGLSICLNLVELMGGKITITSEYGKGSTFHISLPKILGDGKKVERKMEALSLSFDPGARILVVDDSESNLKVAREFLKMFGIAADTASSGAEAIAMVSDLEYDLIFMDHMMPEMDGVQATHRIRALGTRQAGIPIVALTANAVIGTRELLLDSGINDFLAKPIEKIKFQAILAKWLPQNLVVRNKQTPISPVESPPAHAAQLDGQESGQEGESGGSRIRRTLASISKIKDLDLSLGINRIAGNMELYVELLGMIVEKIPETLVKIDTALSESDAGSLNLEIHTLKGSLANMGAVSLANKAAELEQIASREELDLFVEKLEPFRKNLEAFARLLGEKLAPEEDAAQLIVSGDRPHLADTLSTLRAALDTFDHEKSLEIVTELTRFDWGANHNGALKTVYTQIRHFDYDTALKELHHNFPETD